MPDSDDNLLIHWILRDGGKIETTKTQNDLLYNSSTQHLWSAPYLANCQTHDVIFFLKFNAVFF